MNFYRESNIDRAIEVFAVANCIDSRVGATFKNMPQLYYDKFYNIMSNGIEAYNAVIEYAPNFKLKNHLVKAESATDIKNRIIDAKQKIKQNASKFNIQGYVSKIAEEELYKQKPMFNLLSVAIERLKLTQDQVYAILITSYAISILDQKESIDIVHIAEAIQYYSSVYELSQEEKEKEEVIESVYKLLSIMESTEKHESLIEQVVDARIKLSKYFMK